MINNLQTKSKAKTDTSTPSLVMAAIFWKKKMAKKIIINNLVNKK